MSSLLLVFLIVLIFLLMIPLILLIIEYQPHKIDANPEIHLLRRIIFVLAVAKVAFFSIVIGADFLLIAKFPPLGLIILSTLIIAVTLLGVANWWALFEIRKLRKEVE